MPFLRKIRKPKWYRNNEVPWLPDGKLQANALADLDIKHNKLSVWEVDDQFLDRTIAALAAGNDFLTNFDFTLFPEEVFHELGIKMEKTQGECCDKEVAGKHVDLVELTADKVFQLAVYVRPENVKRLFHAEVVRLIRQSLQDGSITVDMLGEHAQKLLRK